MLQTATGEVVRLTAGYVDRACIQTAAVEVVRLIAGCGLAGHAIKDCPKKKSQRLI